MRKYGTLGVGNTAAISPATRAPTLARELARRRIVAFVFIVYGLLIFEGTLRKWVFPEIHEILFFIRDPFVLAVYWMAWRHGFWPRHALFFLFGGLAVLFLAVIAVQVPLTDLSPLVLLYGWRMYFFYMPLAFIVGACFTAADLSRIVKWTLIISIPISFLVYVQFASPVDSFINKQIGDDPGGVFMVAADIVRTIGTFTFTTGQSFFVGGVLAMLLYAWTTPKENRPLGHAALWLASIAVITMLLLSGSRTTFFFAALDVAAATAAIALMPGVASRSKTLLALLMLIPLGVWAFAEVFPAALEAMMERQSSAQEDEGSTLARAFGAFHEFTDVLPDAPFFGYGLGYSTGGGSMLATGEMQFTLAEDEWSRIVLEIGPVFGLLFIGARMMFVLWLAYRAILAARSVGRPLALLLLGFIGIPLMNGSITMQGTVNGFAWLFAGFCIAAGGIPLSRPIAGNTSGRR